MGVIHTEIELRSALDNRLQPYVAKALVDTGAVLLYVPQHIATQLKLPQLQEREVTTADGQRHVCPYVGPVEVTFKNRSCFVGALVLGDEVILGAVPMEDLDLVIVPSTETVDVNPAIPNLPQAQVKTTERFGVQAHGRKLLIDPTGHLVEGDESTLAAKLEEVASTDSKR